MTEQELHEFTTKYYLPPCPERVPANLEESARYWLFFLRERFADDVKNYSPPQQYSRG